MRNPTVRRTICITDNSGRHIVRNADLHVRDVGGQIVFYLGNLTELSESERQKIPVQP